MHSVGEPTRDEPHAETERDYTPAVYGALLVTTLIAVQWRHDVSTTLLGASLIGAVLVFWLTHVWSRVVNQRVHGPIARHEGLAIARDEAPMLTASILPALVLLLLPALGATTDQAVAVALALSIAQLFVWGMVVGRAAHSSWWLAIGVATVDLLLGLAIVTLKVVVLH